MKDSLFNKLSYSDLDRWFSIQTSWSHDLREYVCRKVKIRRFKKFLELGSGTGILLNYFRNKCSDGKFTGTEISPQLTEKCKKQYPDLDIKNLSSIEFLTQTSEKFDIIYCHFYLLWEQNRNELFKLIREHLEEHGYFLIFSEPDYGGVLESPESLRSSPDIRSIQTYAGDPFIGRKLFPELHKAGFRTLESGLISKIKTNLIPDIDHFNREFEFYKLFWSGVIPDNQIKDIKEKIIDYITRGEYFYFIPIAYSILRP